MPDPTHALTDAAEDMLAGDQAFATNAEIDFVEAARPGDVLTASCEIIVQRGRAGISDATVTNQRGDTIAVFRGRTLATRQQT